MEHAKTKESKIKRYPANLQIPECYGHWDDIDDCRKNCYFNLACSIATRCKGD